MGRGLGGRPASTPRTLEVTEEGIMSEEYTPSIESLVFGYEQNESREHGEALALVDAAVRDRAREDAYRAIAAHDREVAAKAWDEGYDDGRGVTLSKSDNPYVQGQQQ